MTKRYVSSEVSSNPEITIISEAEIDGDTGSLPEKSVLFDGEPAFSSGDIDFVKTSSGWLIKE